MKIKKLNINQAKQPNEVVGKASQLRWPHTKHKIGDKLTKKLLNTHAKATKLYK